MTTLGHCARELSLAEVPDVVYNYAAEWSESIHDAGVQRRCDLGIIIACFFPRISPPSTAFQALRCMVGYDLQDIQVDGMPSLADCHVHKSFLAQTKSRKYTG
jgi:hypothetical protein